MALDHASPELLAAVGRKRSLVIAMPGTEELRFLDFCWRKGSDMQRLTIRNVFSLSNGLTVLAVDRPRKSISWSGKEAWIGRRAATARPLRISGESLMAVREPRSDVVALEVREPLDLTREEAESGQWVLSLP